MLIEKALINDKGIPDKWDPRPEISMWDPGSETPI